MNLVGRILRKAISEFWQLKFRLTNLELERLEIGSGHTFNSPVRSGGAGSILIGAENSFGFKLAHRLGSGEILLQPRSKGAVISIGHGNWFNNNVCIVAKAGVFIGDGCQIGDLVSIYDCDFHEISPTTRNRSGGPAKPVKIGNNVWLGSRVMVLKDVTIGENSVVGAMSLVTKSIPPSSLAVGVPAKVIRSIE